MAVMSMESTWIQKANLRKFLQGVGKLTGYELEDHYWIAIQLSLGFTAWKEKKWRKYDLPGDEVVGFEFALDVKTSRVYIRILVPEAVLADIRILIAQCRQW